ncbi:hypothetical protein AV521_31335 [Streptomyces sp. IMTB 2501]|nr:hypothetical protein AV521_31335 [Streptomyces sp. IMTB 2501]
MTNRPTAAVEIPNSESSFGLGRFVPRYVATSSTLLSDGSEPRTSRLARFQSLPDSSVDRPHEPLELLRTGAGEHLNELVTLRGSRLCDQTNTDGPAQLREDL